MFDISVFYCLYTIKYDNTDLTLKKKTHYCYLEGQSKHKYPKVLNYFYMHLKHYHDFSTHISQKTTQKVRMNQEKKKQAVRKMMMMTKKNSRKSLMERKMRMKKVKARFNFTMFY